MNAYMHYIILLCRLKMSQDRSEQSLHVLLQPREDKLKDLHCKSEDSDTLKLARSAAQLTCSFTMLFLSV